MEHSEKIKDQDELKKNTTHNFIFKGNYDGEIVAKGIGYLENIKDKK